jgi:uncharacterized phage protein gp47/JayE
VQLSLQTFTSLVQTAAAAVQGSRKQLLDLTIGSVLRAILEANASIALWIQWLILLVLGTTRAATSNGADLDSWMADFGLIRLPAAPAAGTVTFARFTPSIAAFVSVGTLVRTADGSQSFAVIADPSNRAWSAVQNGYAVAAGVAALDVPVQAASPGAAGNVLPGTVTLLATAIPGVDTVSNPAPLAGGIDAESDAAFRIRFTNYINTRAEATIAAIDYAVASIQQGMACVVVENQDSQGNYRPGNFVVTVDDGSGNPPAPLLARASAAIGAVRPVGSTYSVQSPTVLTANVSLTISVAAGSMKAQVQPMVATALESYIDSLPIGAPLPYTRLAQLAYGASPAVVNVSGLTLNGGTDDLVPSALAVVKAGTIAVN